MVMSIDHPIGLTSSDGLEREYDLIHPEVWTSNAYTVLTCVNYVHRNESSRMSGACHSDSHSC